MQKRHIDRLQYFRELAQTSERYFMPYIKDFLDMAGPICTAVRNSVLTNIGLLMYFCG